MPSELPVIAVRVDPALYLRVKKAAQHDGRTISNYVGQLLARSHPVEQVVHRAPAGIQRAIGGSARPTSATQARQTVSVRGKT